MNKLPRFSRYFSPVLLIIFFYNLALSQYQGIRLNTANAFKGYTLFETFNSTYLINNCGEIVNTWNVNFTNLHSKLLPNGNLLYIQGDIVELDWDGNLVKRTPPPAFDMKFIYEVIKKENGNYLAVGRREFSFQAFQELGYDTDFVNPFYVDIVVEIDGDSGGIVWEWNISDHVIQERDNTLANYGSVFDNPQLINMDAVSRYDWNQEESFMINSFDYNHELELIAISVRKMSEIMIIDQSTTTEEAKGSTGGRYGKGGDVLYRWGNPQNYGRGTSEDRYLYFQHNPNWIDSGPHKGKMTVYNNGLNRPGTSYDDRYSTVPIFTLPMDADGNFILEEGQAFGPKEPEIAYDRERTSSIFFSDYTSGAEVLENGNVFITIGLDDRLIELDETGRVIWHYEVPNSSYIYRAEKYSLDYLAFEGRDLSPTGFYAESPPSNYDCELMVNSIDTEMDKVIFDLKNDGYHLTVENKIGLGSEYLIYDMAGNLVMKNEEIESNYQIDIEGLSSGLYIIKLSSYKNQNQTFKFVAL